MSSSKNAIEHDLDAALAGLSCRVFTAPAGEKRRVALARWLRQVSINGNSLLEKFVWDDLQKYLREVESRNKDTEAQCYMAKHRLIDWFREELRNDEEWKRLAWAIGDARTDDEAILAKTALEECEHEIATRLGIAHVIAD